MSLENEFWAKRRADMAKEAEKDIEVLEQHKRFVKVPKLPFQPRVASLLRRL